MNNINLEHIKGRDLVDALNLTNTPDEQSIESHPDARKHKLVSFAKSAVRIAAGLALAGGGWLEMNPYIMYAGVLLVVAEVLGIVEELV